MPVVRDVSLVSWGGWGLLLGDEGSGFWIGLKALQAIIKAEEGRYVKTFLSNILMNVFNINYLKELVTFVYQQKLPREKIASLAPLLQLQGDCLIILHFMIFFLISLKK